MHCPATDNCAACFGPTHMHICIKWLTRGPHFEKSSNWQVSETEQKTTE